MERERGSKREINKRTKIIRDIFYIMNSYQVIEFPRNHFGKEECQLRKLVAVKVHRNVPLVLM